MRPCKDRVKNKASSEPLLGVLLPPGSGCWCVAGLFLRLLEDYVVVSSAKKVLDSRVGLLKSKDCGGRRRRPPPTTYQNAEHPTRTPCGRAPSTARYSTPESGFSNQRVAARRPPPRPCQNAEHPTRTPCVRAPSTARYSTPESGFLNQNVAAPKAPRSLSKACQSSVKTLSKLLTAF